MQPFKWIILLAFIWTTSCQSPTPINTINSSQCTRKSLPSKWRAKANIVVNENGVLHRGRLIWSQGEYMRLRLLGPFSISIGTIIETSTGFKWTDGKKTYHTETINPLFEKATGWFIPLDEIYQWLKKSMHLHDDIAPSNTPQKPIARVQITGHTCLNKVRLPQTMVISHPDFTASIQITEWSFPQ